MSAVAPATPAMFATAEEMGPLGVEVTVWIPDDDPDNHPRTPSLWMPMIPELGPRHLVAAVEKMGYQCRGPWLPFHSGWTCKKVVRA